MKFFLLSVILFFSLPQEKNSYIIWDQNQKLNWSDFKGTPNPAVSYVAQTSSGIKFGYSFVMEGNSPRITFKVESFFNPETSWYLPRRVNQNVLNHEQTHFDITELHARMLRKQLERKKFTKNIKKEIELIYLKNEEDRKAMQQRFDTETNHSQNLEKEAWWEKQIAKKLKDYESWR